MKAGVTSDGKKFRSLLYLKESVHIKPEKSMKKGYKNLNSTAVRHVVLVQECLQQIR